MREKERESDMVASSKTREREEESEEFDEELMKQTFVISRAISER